MFFYILFALGLNLAVRRSVWLVAVFLLALAAAGSAGPYRSVLLEFHARPVLLDFVAGMLAALAYPRLGTRMPFPAAMLWLGVAGTFAWSLIGMSHPVVQWLAWFCPLLALMGGVTLDARGVAQPRVVQVVGDSSYVIYLSHPFLSEPVVRFGGMLNAGPLLAALLVVLALGAVTCAGLFLHRWVERPLTRTVRLWLGTYRLNRAVDIV